jgi:hypothetical protein
MLGSRLRQRIPRDAQSGLRRLYLLHVLCYWGNNLWMADHAGAVMDSPDGARDAERFGALVVVPWRFLVLAGLVVAAWVGCALLSTAAHASTTPLPGTAVVPVDGVTQPLRGVVSTVVPRSPLDGTLGLVRGVLATAPVGGVTGPVRQLVPARVGTPVVAGPADSFGRALARIQASAPSSGGAVRVPAGRRDRGTTTAAPAVPGGSRPKGPSPSAPGRPDNTSGAGNVASSWFDPTATDAGSVAEDQLRALGTATAATERSPPTRGTRPTVRPD